MKQDSLVIFGLHNKNPKLIYGHHCQCLVLNYMNNIYICVINYCFKKYAFNGRVGGNIPETLPSSM